MPYVFVRANSDYLYEPIQRMANGKGWQGAPPGSYPGANTTTSYRFAIATSSTAVMTMLQLRCLQGNPNGTACIYSPLAL